jgi:hypothetical protein
MSTWRRGTALTSALLAGATLVSGCTPWWTTGDSSSGGGWAPAPAESSSTSSVAPVTAQLVPTAGSVTKTVAQIVVESSPVVTRLTRQGGEPTVRTSRWHPGDGQGQPGTAVQLTYRTDVHLVGVVPLVTPTGATSYRVEKMRVDATARRFLVYVDARSGEPKVVGITAGE